MRTPPTLRRRQPARIEDLPGDLHSILRRIYANRGVVRSDTLELGLAGIADYRLFKDIERAVNLLETALTEQWRILIVGDYDADGATSTAVAIRALGAMGARHLDYLVPNRFEQGYGLTPALVVAALPLRPQLIVTVDNGIAAHDGVRAAQSAGIKVLVTDHHLQGDSLPPAEAIINPNQVGDPFPSKALAGVGVIFYLMSALRARLRDVGWFGDALPEPRLGDLLDLVALGTVADVAMLDRNNRILVEQGLRRIRAGRACPGILALLRVAGREATQVAAMDMGFFVGPRLNAAGRMDDMSIGIECLLTNDPERANALAAQLDALNRDRRAIEQGVREEAVAAVESAIARWDGRNLPAGICLYEADWHEGVLGLVAGRVKDRFHRPTVVLAPGSDGFLKGSARSVPGVHVRDVLATMDAEQPGLLVRFGGHAMAAGLTLDAARLDEFTERFAETVTRHADAEALQPVLWSDGELMPGEFDLRAAEALRAGGPWGQGFPEPLFDGLFAVASAREVGQRHLRLQLRDPRDGQLHEAIAFNYADHGMPFEGGAGTVRFAFRLGINDYRGMCKPQLVIEGYDLAVDERDETSVNS